MSGVRATVVIPTTGDRGPLLRHSVGSVLRQTVTDLEVLVIGDGLDEDGVAVVRELAATDERVRLFEFAKDGRRGERNRHEVLSGHARGRIVTYLCDRDLYLPRHLEVMEDLLADADLGYTLRFRVEVDGGLTASTRTDLTIPAVRRRHRDAPTLVPLSFAGHTLDAYWRLPHGWRTTPPGRFTDRYMFEQFLDEPWVRVAAASVPTVLTFKRGDHPGWTTWQRLPELERWAGRLDEAGLAAELTAELLAVVDADRGRLEALLRPRTLDGALRRLPGPVRRAVSVIPPVGRRLRA